LRGSQNLIINPELKKKKVTKVTEICDDTSANPKKLFFGFVYGFIVSVSFNEPNTKIIN
jgi:hypothetical protein